MNLQPIHGRVLVRPSETGDKTPGGIYIPDTAKGKLQEGEIVAAALSLSMRAYPCQVCPYDYLEGKG